MEIDNISRAAKAATVGSTLLGAYVDMQNSFGFRPRMLAEVGQIANLVGDIPLGMAAVATGHLVSVGAKRISPIERHADTLGIITTLLLVGLAAYAELHLTQLGNRRFTPDPLDLPGLFIGALGTRIIVSAFTRQPTRPE